METEEQFFKTAHTLWVPNNPEVEGNNLINDLQA